MALSPLYLFVPDAIAQEARNRAHYALRER
jgi:hypothetical protein